MLVSGIWNAVAKLTLPILALALVLLQGSATGGRVAAALTGIAGLVAAIMVFALLLRSEELARRFRLLAGRVASRLLRLVGRPAVQGWELATVKFRTRTLELLEHGWLSITARPLVSHLSLYVVLLACLRAAGVSDAEVAWAQALVVRIAVGGELRAAAWRLGRRSAVPPAADAVQDSPDELEAGALTGSRPITLICWRVSPKVRSNHLGVPDRRPLLATGS